MCALSEVEHYAQDALSLQFLVDCCSRDPTLCRALKQKYPTLADKDNSTNPNFCYMRGNVCSR